MGWAWDAQLKRACQNSYVLKFIGYLSNGFEEEHQVRLTWAHGAVPSGIAVLLAATLVPVALAAGPAASIRILFDLGDGTYVWADESIPDVAAPNATWDAVRHAASANGIVIESAWYPCCGVAVLDLGGRHPPAGFVGLLEWNGTANAWRFAETGISGLVVQDQAAIALSNGAFAGAPSYIGKFPVPTPAHPRPSSEFRGDLSNTGVAGSPAPDRIRLLWDRDTGSPEIGSTPAVAYGLLFVSTMKGMRALDADTGEVRWTNARVRGFSSPAIFNDSAYVGTANGTVVRLGAMDGVVEWETRLLASTSFTGISSSPKVAFDSVFIGTFNETGGPGEVVSLWEGNGTVRWRHPTGSVHFSSPAFRDGTVYVGIMGRYNTTTQISFDPPFGVLALNADTGEQRWFTPTGGSVAASPALLGETIVAAAKDGTVYGLNRTTGGVQWTAPVDAGVSSAAIFDRTAYVGGGSFGASGRVVALDVATGSINWSFSPNGPVQSSVTYAGGKVLFATNTAHGTIYALNAATGTLAWSYEPLPSQYILGSPIVADGVVYAPSDNGHVVALADSPSGPPSIPLGVVLAIGGLVVAVAAAAVIAWFLVRRKRRGGP
jgi:outer membrane protein assembly factor BamB